MVWRRPKPLRSYILRILEPPRRNVQVSSLTVTPIYLPNGREEIQPDGYPDQRSDEVIDETQVRLAERYLHCHDRAGVGGIETPLHQTAARLVRDLHVAAADEMKDRDEANLLRSRSTRENTRGQILSMTSDCLLWNRAKASAANEIRLQLTRMIIHEDASQDCGIDRMNTRY